MQPACLSVILCTTGERRSVPHFLTKLRTSLDVLDEPSEMILVHNACRPSTELQDVCETVGARYLHEPAPGLSIARNRGVLAARGEFLAFVDDDVAVAADWASRLVTSFFGEPHIEAVTGPIVASPNSTAAGVQWSGLYGLDCAEGRIFERSTPIPFFPLTASQCGRGGNMAFRRPFLLRHGLFDPHFGVGGPVPGGDEVDRFYSVLRCGKRILLEPALRVEHIYTDNQASLRRKIAGYAAAQTAFLLKCFVHDPQARPLVVRFIGARLRALFSRSRGKSADEVRAPRFVILRGSLWGPFAYTLSLLREALWPARTVVRLDRSTTSDPAGRLSVLMLLYNSGLGGAERLAGALALSLRSHINVAVIVPGTGATTAALRAADTPVGIVPRQRLKLTLNPMAHLSYLLRFAGTVAAYRRTIRIARPDVVHIDNHLNLPALLAARLSGVRTVLHLQEIPAGWARRAIAWLSGMLADRTVAVSCAATQPLTAAARQKAVVVYNGTRPASDCGWNVKGYISFFGRLSADKDPVSFVLAAKAVHEREPSARFLLCGVTVPGRKRYEARLARLIALTGIADDQFRVVKDVDDTSDLLAQSSLVVGCCLVESFGLAILEAMAAGKPVVVPRSGAFPEYITDGETGLFYSQGNIEEMAECILRLLHDPSLAQRIGAAARALATSRFTDTRMADEFMEQYRLLLGQPGNAAPIGSHG